ncbi:MAG: hypothetical protein WA936_10710 [Erythrobacter sp.]|uniref:hypothetical protein n=1 Tax=Erythrobacter sp. TaxID=1042 RepID=UPI003C78F711
MPDRERQTNPRAEREEILEHLKRQLVRLDAIGAHVTAAHLDTAIHHLKLELK